MLNSVINNTAWTQTNIAKLIYNKLEEVIKATKTQTDKYIAEYTKEIEKPNPQLGRAELSAKEKKKLPKTIKVKEVPQDDIPELNDKIVSHIIEVEWNPLIIPALKMAIANFPHVVKDKETGEIGLKGKDDIEAYENLKEKFMIE